jgi:hypothetical protein
MQTNDDMTYKLEMNIGEMRKGCEGSKGTKVRKKWVRDSDTKVIILRGISTGSLH